jgi:anti-anti-sigma factor
MVAPDSGAMDMTFELNLSARTNSLDPDEPPQIGGEDVAVPVAIHLEPMHDGWVRVRVEGELALNSSSTLERAVESELTAHSHVLLDLSGIDFIDSAGLRAMTALVRSAKATGCQLRLSTELPPHARRLMEIVGLLPFVPIGIDDPWAGISRLLPDAPST